MPVVIQGLKLTGASDEISVNCATKNYHQSEWFVTQAVKVLVDEGGNRKKRTG